MIGYLEPVAWVHWCFCFDSPSRLRMTAIEGMKRSLVISEVVVEQRSLLADAPIRLFLRTSS
jgi:hypothetical protein